VVAQARVVEQDAGDDERARERPATCLVDAGDEASAELRSNGGALAAARRHARG
jgi:hypothetical protein